MSSLGYNYRLAEPLAAIAAANLARFPLLARRQQQTAALTATLAGCPGFAVPPAVREDWNGYSPLVRLDLPAREILPAPRPVRRTQQRRHVRARRR